MWFRLDRHLTDEQLLIMADGELPPEQAVSIREHLASCWHCRARATRMELAIADFIELHEQRFHRQPVVGPGTRASLQAQLRLQAKGFEMRSSSSRSMAYIAAYAAILLVMVGAGLWFVLAQRRPFALSAQMADPALPIRRFTPGAVQSARLTDLCRMTDSDTPPAVAPAVKQQVFDEYRLPVSTSQSYELDYLITPQLGGADDPRNLWPEPYGVTAWNAHIKDELEDRLHSMVCDGSLDLATAQQDIAVDWIAAYKKYFHTQVPLNEAQAGIRMPAPVHRWSAGF
jgi:hypothetical protein